MSDLSDLFSDYPKTLGRLTSGKRVYFADLRTNDHGSFLRLTQTISRSTNRFSVYIPIEGVEDLRKLLVEITDEFGSDEKGLFSLAVLPGHSKCSEFPLPPSQQLRDVRNKMFYFDCNSNEAGQYLRITEVGFRHDSDLFCSFQTRYSSDNRTSITVSLKNLARFHEILGEFISSISVALSLGEILGNFNDLRGGPEADETTAANNTEQVKVATA